MSSFQERYNDPGLFATKTCLPYSNRQEDSEFLKQNSGFDKQNFPDLPCMGSYYEPFLANTSQRFFIV